MIEQTLFFFAHNPLLMLFAVVALGYPISKIRIAGASFGIASILFAGIALGALVMAPGLDPGLKKDISREMKLVYERAWPSSSTPWGSPSPTASGPPSAGRASRRTPWSSW